VLDANAGDREAQGLCNDGSWVRAKFTADVRFQYVSNRLDISLYDSGAKPNPPITGVARIERPRNPGSASRSAPGFAEAVIGPDPLAQPGLLALFDFRPDDGLRRRLEAESGGET